MVMHRIKIGLQIAGAAVAALGVLCLPVGFGVNPKRDLSAFFNLADMGIFLKAALVLIPHWLQRIPGPGTHALVPVCGRLQKGGEPAR